jgi:hypothetical protein
MPRVTRYGLHENSTPASHDSNGRRVTWKASRKAAYPVITIISRYTTLKVVTIPRGPSNGSATRSWKIV